MAGPGTLNAVMLVRVQLLQLRHPPRGQKLEPTTEVIRPDKDPVLKTGGECNARLRVQVPRLPLDSVGCFISATDAESYLVLWPSGKGSSLTRRRSVVRVHPGSLETRHCEFLSQRCHSETTGPRRAARSARHPVKVEIVGSNPTGGALQQDHHATW